MPGLIPSTGEDVLPATDSDFELFATNFGAIWVPGSFNVVLPLAATIVASATAFSAALTAATNPATRTSITVAAKNAARAATSELLRGAIRSAQTAFLDGVATEAQLNALNVRANSLIRTPIAAPVFAPILSFDGADSGVVRLRITQVDPVTGSAIATRAYAYGLSGVEMERKIGEGSFLPIANSRRVKINDNTVGIMSGTALQYRARYFTARGLTSPWSPAVSTVAP